MIFKFNGGIGAVLCSNCHRILMAGREIPKYIWDAVNDDGADKLPDMYCEDCKKKIKKNPG